jgi:hypothetical protein
MNDCCSRRAAMCMSSMQPHLMRREEDPMSMCELQFASSLGSHAPRHVSASTTTSSTSPRTEAGAAS